MRDLILLTGGVGDIGSHTAVELIQAGFEVVIVDNLYNSSRDVLNGIHKITGTMPHFEEFDLCDSERVDQLFTNYNHIRAVIHFAAYKSVGESVQKPLEYYENNLFSLINLLKTMQMHKVHLL